MIAESYIISNSLAAVSCFKIIVGNIHYNTEDLLRILIERHETEKLKLQFEGNYHKCLSKSILYKDL